MNVGPPGSPFVPRDVKFPEELDILSAWAVRPDGSSDLVYLLAFQLRCTADEPETCDADHQLVVSLTPAEVKDLAQTILKSLRTPTPPPPLNPN